MATRGQGFPACDMSSDKMGAMRAHTGGAQIGKRYAGREASYDPSTGRSYRTAVTLEPTEAERLLILAKRANMSVSGFLNRLVKNVEVDPVTGLPPFIDAPDQDLNLFKEAS